MEVVPSNQSMTTRMRIATSLAGVVTATWLTQQLAAGTYEVRLSTLEGAYGYGELRETPTLELGSALLSVSSIEVEVSGVHSNGWYSSWGGDGPLGAAFFVSIEAPPWANARTSGDVRLTTNGPISVTFPIPKGTIVPDWSQLLDGRARIYALSDTAGFAGGGTVLVAPYLELTKFILRIDAVPAVHLAYDVLSGELSWSTIPRGGHLRVYVTTGLDRPWELAGSYDADSPFPKWTIGDAESRFFKAVWFDGAVEEPRRRPWLNKR
jgi:hypothetical protein